MIGAKEPAARREFEDKLLHGIVTYMSKKYHDLSWAFELCEKVLARFRRYVPTVNEMHKHPEADANALATGKFHLLNATFAYLVGNCQNLTNSLADRCPERNKKSDLDGMMTSQALRRHVNRYPIRSNSIRNAP